MVSHICIANEYEETNEIEVALMAYLESVDQKDVDGILDHYYLTEEDGIEDRYFLLEKGQLENLVLLMT